MVPVAIYGLPPLADVWWMYRKVLTSLGCNPYMGMPSIQASDHQNCGPRFSRIYKPPIPPWGLGYDIRYQWPYICCQPFQMACGCLGNVLQAWDITHTWGCHPSRPQSTKDVVQDFTQSEKSWLTALVLRGLDGGHPHV